MTDGELRSELERRANTVSVDRDWARHDLLPAVNDAIDSRPLPVLTSRVPALGSLIGLAAILLLLAVAVPRFVPGPSSTDVPTASNVPSTSAAADSLRVMSAQEFATAVRQTHLSSTTVLVDGTIGARPPANDDVNCHVPPDDPCLMGRLEETDPSVDVLTRWLATDDPIPNVASPGEVWTWFHLPSGPITGTLVLSVDGDGATEFLGMVRDPMPTEPLTVADASRLDLASLSLDDAVLVSGWLTGQGGSPPCPTAPPFHGLPLRDCVHPAWIVGEREASAESGIRLQNDAYFEFAPDPTPADVLEVEPRHATYVLAKRLVGAGAGCDSPPCWQWEVIGRLSEPTELVPTPAPAQTPSVSTPPIAESEIECTGGGQVAITDETGLIVRCEATRQEASQEEPLLLANPVGDTSILELTWSGVCVDFRFTLRPAPTDAFELVAFNPTPVNVICDGLPMRTEVRLYLSQPIDRQLVSLTMTRAPAATPWPRPSPQAAPWDEAVGCDGSPSGFANGAVRIADHTGLVTICQLPDSIDGDPAWLPDMAGVLTFSWETPCASDTHRTLLEFWRREPASEGSQRAPYVLVADRFEPDQDEGSGCFPAIGRRTVQLLLEPPVEKSDVEFMVITEEDSVDVVGSDRSMFHLSMSATKPSFSSSEQVDVTATLAVRGIEDVITVSGMSVHFTVEQLDGPLSLKSGPTTQICGNGELTPGEPEIFSLADHYLVTEPFGGRDSVYNSDPFVLPSGGYRVHVDVRFWLGGGCTGETVDLQAWMLVRVE